MSRCLHVHDSGFQCLSEPVEGTDFCDTHQKIVSFVQLDDHSLRKLILRFVALILLILFLIPIAYTLKYLYLGPPSEAQEVW